MKNGIIICLLLLGLVGCQPATFKPYRYNHNWDKHVFQESGPTTAFPIPRTPVQMKQVIYRDQNYRGYQTSFIWFDSVGNNGQPGNYFTAYYFKSKKPGPKKIAVILPIWGGDPYPSRVIADSLARFTHGDVNVIWILGKERLMKWTKLEESPTPEIFIHRIRTLANRMKLSMIDIKRLTQWAVTQTQQKFPEVFAIGVSIGGSSTALLSKVDPNITGAIPIVGGAGPVDMLFNCDYEPVEIRKAITKRFGWSDEKYKSILFRYLHSLNVTHYPARVNPANILIFEGIYDSCVTPQSRHELWLTLGKPARVSIPYDHVQSLLNLTALGRYMMRYEIVNFVNTH